MQTVIYRVNGNEYFWVIANLVKGKVARVFILLFVMIIIINELTARYEGSVDVAFIWQGVLINILFSLLFCLSVMVVAVPIALGVIWYRMSKYGWVNKEVKFGFSEKGLVSETAITKMEFKWELVKKVKSDAAYFWLWLKPPSGQLLFVPKRVFNHEQLSEFEKLLKEKALWNC